MLSQSIPVFLSSSLGMLKHQTSKKVRPWCIDAAPDPPPRGESTVIVDTGPMAQTHGIVFNPMYPHGDVTVPGTMTPKVKAHSVEALWQGSIVERTVQDPDKTWLVCCDIGKLCNASVCRTPMCKGAVLGGSVWLPNVDIARDTIYWPAYDWVLSTKLLTELHSIARLLLCGWTVIIDDAWEVQHHRSRHATHVMTHIYRACANILTAAPDRASTTFTNSSTTSSTTTDERFTSEQLEAMCKTM